MSRGRVLALLMMLVGCTVAMVGEATGPKAYVILEVTVHDPVMYEEYLEAIAPLCHGSAITRSVVVDGYDAEPYVLSALYAARMPRGESACPT